MCYVYPGPRCSSHARTILANKKRSYNRAIEGTDSDKAEKAYLELADARRNYYMTPKGQDILRKEIESGEGNSDEAEMNLEYGIECRKIALQQAKQAERGDVNGATGGKSRIPEIEVDPTQKPEYKELKKELDERTNSDEFVGYLNDRDEIRETREDLKAQKEAQQEYVEELQRISTNPKVKDSSGNKVDEFSEEEVLAAQDKIDDEYEKIRELVEARRRATYEYHVRNDKVEKFKDETAQIVAKMNDIAGDPGISYEESTLGEAVEVATYDSGTREWLEERQKGIGGSDVGMILRADAEFAQSNFKQFLDSKVESYSEEEVADQAEANSGFSGPTGRGNAWETAVVREYQENNPEATVMYSKASWVHAEDKRYKLNVDGLLSTDGVNPDGILEIKTASHRSHWYEKDENGVEQDCIPVGYRAQVLWYLRHTGFKYADIAAKIDDREYVQRRIYADEAIDPSIVLDKKRTSQNLKAIGSGASEDQKEAAKVWKQRIPNMEESMSTINRVWNDEVKARNEGTYEKSNGKSSMEESAKSEKIQMATRQLSAWSDKSHDECEKIIRGYNDYKKASIRDGQPYLTRDAYMVEEFKKVGPQTWTRDRTYTDIETSGMSPDSGEIIEIGITRVNPKGEIVFNMAERFGVEDERVLDITGTGMQEVHKIAPDDIRGNRSFRDPEVQKIMQEHLNDPNSVMVAHNESFEKRWFSQNIDGFWNKHAYTTTRRYKAEREGKPVEPLTTLDTMWTQRYLVSHTENNKLATFTEGHGVPYENAHSADADTRMTLEATYKFDEIFRSAPFGHRYDPKGEYDDDDIFA